jgi:hypothetical protein
VGTYFSAWIGFIGLPLWVGVMGIVLLLHKEKVDAATAASAVEVPVAT